MMWRICSLREQWVGEAVGVRVVLVWSDSLPWWEERGKERSLLGNNLILSPADFGAGRGICKVESG